MENSAKARTQPKNLIVRFFLSILRSVLLSILLLLLLVSFLTKEFPPNPRRISKIYESVKRLMEYSQVYVENSNPQDFEKDIERLREIQEKRMHESQSLEVLLGETRRVQEQISEISKETTNRQDIVNLKSKVEILLEHQKTIEDRLVAIERKIR